MNHPLNHADAKVGRAASVAESAKESRYGPQVLPLAFESCGRLGAASIEALSALRQEAMIWGSGAFDCHSGARFLHWRRELETVVAYQLADATLLCLGRSAQKFTTLLTR